MEGEVTQFILYCSLDLYGMNKYIYMSCVFITTMISSAHWMYKVDLWRGCCGKLIWRWKSQNYLLFFWQEPSRCVTKYDKSNLLKNNTYYYYYCYYYYSAPGLVWTVTRAQSGNRYGSGTLHPGQVFRGSLPLLSPAFRRSHFRRQMPPRPQRRERS